MVSLNFGEVLAEDADLAAVRELHAQLGLDVSTSSAAFCGWPLVECDRGRYSIAIPAGSAAGVRFGKVSGTAFCWALPGPTHKDGIPPLRGKRN